MKVSPDYARRDAFVGWLVNQVLRVASSRYRAVIGGAIRYGMRAALKDEREYAARCGRVFVSGAPANHHHACLRPWSHTGSHICCCGASVVYVDKAVL